MMRAEFQSGDMVAFRLFGAEVQGEICAILGPRASVQITHAPHFPRLIGTAWCVYQRRLTRVVDSGYLFGGEHASLATRTTCNTSVHIGG